MKNEQQWELKFKNFSSNLDIESGSAILKEKLKLSKKQVSTFLDGGYLYKPMLSDKANKLIVFFEKIGIVCIKTKFSDRRSSTGDDLDKLQQSFKEELGSKNKTIKHQEEIIEQLKQQIQEFELQDRDIDVFDSSDEYFKEPLDPSIKPLKKTFNNSVEPTISLLKEDRPVSWQLGIGIFLIPLIFSWFTLRKGHTTKSKVWSFGWLTVLLLMSVQEQNNASSNVTPKEAIKKESVYVTPKKESVYASETFIATISCGDQRQSIQFIALECFLNTKLKITKNNRSKIYTYTNLAKAGRRSSSGSLLVELPKSFKISASNSSEYYILKIEISNSKNNVVFSDEAAEYGHIRIHN